MEGAMDHHFSRTLRIISTIVLAFFLWTFGGVFDIAHAIKADSRPSTQASASSRQQTNKDKPEEKLGKDMEDIENILKDDKSDHETKKQKIKTKKADIDADDIEIKKQFKDTEDKIKHLPGEIWKRHQDFVKKYDDNLLELKTNLDDIENAKTDTEKELAQKKAKDFIEKVKPPKKHQKLDPNKLPHRTEEPVFKEPRTKPEEFTEGKTLTAQNIERKPLLLASNGSLKGLLSRDSKYSPYAVIPAPDYGIRGQAPAGNQKPGYPTETLGYDKQNSRSISALPEGSYQTALASPPTTADLAETIEVQFTPEIKAKAQALGNNPVKIYNWVRNNIEYVPTYGSIQGADMCLQTKQCNDMDTASLLIALLRASGIYAHYVYGTIQLPIEKVKNWVGGFTDSMEALRLLASAGVPTKGLTVGGQIAYVQMEHVYAEAWIDFIPSRGEIHKVGNLWIPLDASFKQYKYTPGMDIKSAVPFDAQTFINQIQSTATINQTAGYVTNVNSSLIQQTMQGYQTQVQNYITQNYPNATVGDVLGKKEIIQQNYSYLLGTLPYKRIVTGAKYSAIPDNLRHYLAFNVTKDIYDSVIGTPINITKSLPELSGKKITLSYSPATSADEAVINSYLPKPHADGSPVQPSELPTSLPAYLINVKPELMIDGVVVATGSAVGMGAIEDFKMTFSGPRTNDDLIANQIYAGEYLGIALDLGKISAAQISALKTSLETVKAKLYAGNFSGLKKDDMLGDMLYFTSLLYFAELDISDFVQAKSMAIGLIRLPSEAIASLTLNVKTFFGIPVSVSSGGLFMDVDRVQSANCALDGDKGKVLQFMQTSGMAGSALEHSVPEQLFSTPTNQVQGISAVKALQIASDQGMPIYLINQSNLEVVLPQLQLDSDTISDIRNAVNSGKEVTVSKGRISFNGWVGCGYIVNDPVTGAAGYMISGGLAGAAILSALKMLIINLYLLPSGRGFDEVGEAARILKEELYPLVAYWCSYIVCVARTAAADLGEKINDAAGLINYSYYAIFALAMKQLSKRLFGALMYVLVVGSSMIYLMKVGEACVNEQR